MSDVYKRQSALAHLHLAQRAALARGEEQGVCLCERPFRAIVSLRGDRSSRKFTSTVKDVCGLLLPKAPNTVSQESDHDALWMGPDEWWVVCDRDAEALTQAFRNALEGQHAAVVDVSESYTIIEIAGPAASAVLEKGCPVDLHPSVFKAGQCLQTHLSKATVTLQQVSDEPLYRVFVRRSFADYCWRWLSDAAQEYGLAVMVE